MDGTCKIKKSVDTATFLWIFAVAFLCIFILFPLLCVFSKIRWSDLSGIMGNAGFRKTILNTFLECICSTGLSVFTGYVYAYAIVFGRLPLRKFFASLPVLHLITPPFVGGLAFILLLGRQGLITKTLLGLDVSLYGFPGLLIAQTLCFFPLAYLMCKESMEALNKNLIEGAVSLGASKRKIFLRIILPLTFPAVVSSFLFIAVSVLSDFGNPMIVGGRFKVLAVEIYTQLTGWMNAGVSAALGLMLLCPSLLLFFLQNRLFKSQTKKTAVIGGKGMAGKEMKSDQRGLSPLFSLFKRGQPPLFQASPSERVFTNSILADILLFVFVLIIAAAIILQFISIIAGSFQKLWGIDTSFTLNHLKHTFKYGKDFANSLLFALIAATLSVMIAAFVSFCVHRVESSSIKGRNFVDSLIQLPSAIPGTLFGLALSITANIFRVKAPKVLIVLAITVAFIPFSYRIVTSALGQIKNSLDEGARSLGARPLRVFFRVLIPLVKSAVFSGWTYNFARGVGTLSSVIFLVSFNTPLCSVRILNLAEQGDWGRSACMAMELTLITFGIITLGKILLHNKKRPE